MRLLEIIGELNAAAGEGKEKPLVVMDAGVATSKNRKLLRRVLALASELGSSVGDLDPDLPDDPVAASWELCSAAPVEQLDRQRLLETDDPTRRRKSWTVS